MDTENIILVLSTCKNLEEGKALARKLVEEKLVACVNCLPGISSTYFWEGEVCEESEVLLLCKSTKEKYTELESFIKKHHSYDTPEVLSLRVDAINDDYANWLGNSVSRP